MVAPVDFSPQRQQRPEATRAAASKTSIALGVINLSTASTAITLAVCEPPSGFNENTYFLTLSGVFFAGVAGVMAAIWVANDPRGRHATAVRNHNWQMVAPVVFAPQRQQASETARAAASKASTALGVLGLSTASMVITLAVCEPPPGFNENTYFLTLSGVFFAGVAGVMAAVWAANNTHGRHAMWGKLVYASIVPLAVGLSVASVL
ncbi:uncharacterized protein LOC133887248 [Phragmites australis]|uniref:uncharacterized protein LOC133887248 n=1 Tax=Phragmites australis TaxID=29695 RepID=UPI002D773C95|nr:uncharacterized protein LOC133887248 [Phragmites australis]